MKIAIIGRSENLYSTAQLLIENGHSIVCILTAKEAPEYLRGSEDFGKLAKQLEVPFAHSAKIESQLHMLKETGADIGVSINYPAVIPKIVTDAFPHGILNAHGGDLPRYRGNACQAWAIINGEDKIGLCVHRMVGGELDNGDIIEREFFPIGIQTKIAEVYEFFANRIPQLFLQAIDRLAADPSFCLEVQSKDPLDALRCYPRRPEDGRIDWNQGALNILRLINASNHPYSGAFCYLDGQKLIIWDAEIDGCKEMFCAIPGQVLQIEKTYVNIATGKGVLRITKVEHDDQTGNPAHWIKSIRNRLG
jgi:methionyl-tRNA formyltransferase